MIARDEQILNLIPQRPPIVMIDKFFSAADGKTMTGLTVKTSNIFVEDGFLREPGLIENIAQSAAAGVGYVYSNSGKPIPLGFIGAVKNLKVYSLPAVGDELVTDVKIEHEVFEITMISSRIHSNEKLVAECEMKIYLQPSQ
ncbi:MAG: hydroxymyristoyl-ACP dehydratase [Bacteroidota bacterium]